MQSDDTLRLPWKRFWVKHDGEVRVDANGYLQPPLRGRGLVDFQRDVFEYQEIDSRRFLALMGETGSGKSHAAQDLVRAMTSDENHCTLVDLGVVESASRLTDQLVPAIAAIERGQRATVFFDAYEDCPLGDRTDRYLADVLSKSLSPLLSVRVVCRSGTWTRSVEQRLSSLWPRDATGAFELCRLTRGDVLAALALVEPHPEQLLASLDQRDLAPLLSVPVSLRQIMMLHQRGEPVAELTKEEIYDRCTRLLARSAETPGAKLDVEQRLAIAKRLAAVSVFCNRPAFYEQPDTGARPPSDASVADVLRGTEPLQYGDEIRIDEPAVREVLRHTGLFNSRGTGRLGWVHASYAEYLASKYVAAHAMTGEQIVSLIRLREDGHQLVSHLQGVATWLFVSNQLPNRQQFIMRAPTTVLRADVKALPDDDRRLLVDSLLAEAEHGTLDLRSAEVRHRLSRLGHSTLSQQLRDRFSNRKTPIGGRILAIRIARACVLDDLAQELARLATAEQEQLEIREEAASAVIELHDEHAHLCLRALLEPNPKDEDDELKAAALTALWPMHLSADELFSSLTAPKRPSLYGRYVHFLRGLPQQLTVAHLPAALRWAAKQPQGESGRHLRLAFVVDAIIAQGMSNAGDRSVLELVCPLVVARLKQRSRIFRTHDVEVQLDADTRRRLLVEIVPTLADAKRLFSVLTVEPRLFGPSDVPWLVDIVANPPGDVQPWLDLLCVAVQFLRNHLSEHFEEVYRAKELHPSILEPCRAFLGPVTLDSELADALRSASRAENEIERVRAEHTAQERAQNQAIINAAINGDKDAFIHVAIALEPGSGFDLDLASLDGWERLESDERRGLLNAARKFLAQHDDERAEWLGKDDCSYERLAGFRAFRLLATEAEGLRSLDPSVWKRWIGVIIAAPAHNAATRIKREELLSFAKRHAADELLEALPLLLRNERVSASRVEELLPIPWEPSYLEILLRAASQGTSTHRAELLEALFTLAPAIGQRYAEELVGSTGVDENLKDVARRLLYLRGSATARAAIAAATFTPGNEAGRRVAELLAHDRDTDRRQLEMLSEMDLAHLFVWLWNEYPDVERTGEDAVQFDEIRDFRQSLIEALHRSDRPQTLEALDYIIDALPDNRVLRLVRRQAAERVETSEWNPPTIEQLFSLARAPLKRFIATAEELRVAIVESLKRFQVDLSESETPASEFLWNSYPDGKGGIKFTPKDEAALSNFLKRHLEADLKKQAVIVNREVEISRPGRGTIGQRTDIHVNAATPQSKLTVIVEVKKCSNDETRTHLKTQLVDRYLIPTGNHHGVFVVGRYDSDGVGTCCDESKADLEELLTTQAASVLPAHVVTPLVLDVSLPPSMRGASRS